MLELLSKDGPVKTVRPSSAKPNQPGSRDAAKHTVSPPGAAKDGGGGPATV